MINKLQTILTQMLEDGQQRDKVPQKRKLSHGLHLCVTAHSQGVTLEISRDYKYPSAQEWKTVMLNFPYFVDGTNPVQTINSDRRFALRAEIPNRRTVAEQLKFDLLSKS